MRIFLMAIMIFILAGCAQKADEVPSKYVSDKIYSKQSCEQLFDEINIKQYEIDRLSTKQNNKRFYDVLSVGIGIFAAPFVLLYPIFVPDYDVELSTEKGRLEAVERAFDKKCPQQTKTK